MPSSMVTYEVTFQQAGLWQMRASASQRPKHARCTYLHMHMYMLRLVKAREMGMKKQLSEFWLREAPGKNTATAARRAHSALVRDRVPHALPRARDLDAARGARLGGRVRPPKVRREEVD